MNDLKKALKYIAELEERNRVLNLELQATRKLEGPGVIMVSSLISHRTQKPRIDIQVGEIHTQMDAAAAMDVALSIIQCATGSYADGFVFNFVTKELGQPQNVGARIIEEFRDYRETLKQEFDRMQERPEDK